ncbi:YkuS family protein [Alicyclobacillus vulcanalis]|uniref:Uncharacterized protein family (UPF0180) n=1 Tax=Alicyclobacillus vulcanalis TaxID=252246 RepID=A0A1N7ME59_9BACL|nr:YkuS family protein [Alicyclobacillus vulcanalis]SIS84328.1 Uncharacterised protein family (UPF0180) [Alicyclobacillus vulcanalis]
MKAVAVEPGLTPVKEYLQSQGCQVVDMSSHMEPSVGAVVITGLDKNLMGMQSAIQQVPVISADGLSPEDVYDRVKAFLQ